MVKIAQTLRKDFVNFALYAKYTIYAIIQKKGDWKWKKRKKNSTKQNMITDI